MLIDRPLREVIEAFASPDPTPGGGSASALAASIGASLLMMVAAMPKTRTGAPEDRAALDRARAAVAAVQQELVAAVDADSAAYDEVVGAYRRPKSSDEEKAARTAAIQRALRTATEVPLSVMRLGAAALEQAAVVAAHGHSAAASDVGVAMALLRAGIEGAQLNVEINLGSLSDATFISAVRAESQRIMAATAR